MKCGERPSDQGLLVARTSARAMLESHHTWSNLVPNSSSCSHKKASYSTLKIGSIKTQFLITTRSRLLHAIFLVVAATTYNKCPHAPIFFFVRASLALMTLFGTIINIDLLFPPSSPPNPPFSPCHPKRFQRRIGREEKGEGEKKKTLQLSKLRPHFVSPSSWEEGRQERSRML